MIEEIKFYNIVCDSCEVILGEEEELSLWQDKKQLEQFRIDEGWNKVNDKHFCINCKLRIV